MGGEVKGKLANAVGSQYPSHYLGTWCIQHYYRWCAHLGYQQSTELTPPADLNGLVRFAERRNLISARVPSHFNWVCTNFIDKVDKGNTHRLMYWLSYTRQAPSSSWQDSCHRIHVSSMSAPNTIGAGMVPISRTLIHWIPSANDRWSSWTHLQSRHN